MNASVQRPEVAGFVAAVRQELDDLGPEVVEELTDGLDADLQESLLEPDGGADELPDPVVYAAELRAAADLPPRRATGVRGVAVGRDALVRGRQLVSRGRELLRAQHERAWWAPLREYVAVGSAVWWVARGWLATLLLGRFWNGRWPEALPPSTVGRLTMLALVLASVELGRRGRPGRTRGIRGALIPVNVLVLLAAPWALTAVGQSAPNHVRVIDTPPSQGLWLQGIEVRNVFPYGSDGRPLQNVQLYTDTGRALEVGSSAQLPIHDIRGRYTDQVPAYDAYERPLWNVFPLRQRVLSSDGTELDRQRPEAASPPRTTIPPLAPVAASRAPTTPGSPTTSPAH